MSSPTWPAPRPILIVEDSAEDFETMLRAFRKLGGTERLLRCESGDEALDYLRRRGRYADKTTSPRPGVVLLDLNLPGTDGRDVLRDVKADPELKQIPVIVLTTSADERDIAECYRLGANSYVQKPLKVDEFGRSMQRLRDYWFDLALLPERE